MIPFNTPLNKSVVNAVQLMKINQREVGLRRILRIFVKCLFQMFIFFKTTLIKIGGRKKCNKEIMPIKLVTRTRRNFEFFYYTF